MRVCESVRAGLLVVWGAGREVRGGHAGRSQTGGGIWCEIDDLDSTRFFGGRHDSGEMVSVVG